MESPEGDAAAAGTGETPVASAFTYAHDFILAAAPDRVFRALIDPAELTRWFAEHAQIEPRRDGVYRFWGRHTLGTPSQDSARQTITTFQPNEALGFLWPVNEVDTEVTMTLVPDESGTRLTLSHAVSADLGVPRQRELIDDHWRRAMGNLSTHLAGGAATLPDYFTSPS
jgi:uncharacterized protein YndB with AHSA1/START domain